MVNKKGMVGLGPQPSHFPTGSIGGPGLGTIALALGVLGGLGAAALLIGVIVWQRRRHRGEER